MLETLLGVYGILLSMVTGILLVVLLSSDIGRRTSFPGPRYLFGVGPWLSYLRYLLHGIPVATSYYNNKYGDLVRVWVAGTPTILITRPSAANHVLKTNGNNYCRRFANDEGLRHIGMFENGIIWNNHLTVWKRLRGFFQKALNAETLAQAIPVSIDATRRMMAKIPDLRTRKIDGRIEALDFVRRITLEVTNRLMIGVQIQDDEDLVERIVHYFKAWEYFLIRPTAMYSGKTGYDSHVRSVKALQEAVGGLVDLKIADMTPELQDNEDLNFTESLLQAKDETGSGVTIDNIRQCLLEMLLAGTDTSSVTVYYLLVSLADHPDVQDKIVQEIKEVVGDAEVTKNDLPRLVYMEHALKESMRVKPVGPVIMRRAIQDDVIEGFPIDAGTHVVINLARMHRRMDSFERPDSFDPGAHFADRTLGEEYVPFGTGPKGCIGQFLAMVEMKTILATFLREYAVRSCGETLKDIETRWDIAQQPTNPSFLYFEPRTSKE